MAATLDASMTSRDDRDELATDIVNDDDYRERLDLLSRQWERAIDSETTSENTLTSILRSVDSLLVYLKGHIESPATVEPPAATRPQGRAAVFGPNGWLRKPSRSCARRTLLGCFPIFSWLGNYSLEDLKADVPAGLTLGFMMIPTAIAYAQIAGLDPLIGLYSALLPVLMYALMGTSRHLSIGPVAIMSLLLNEAILDGQKDGDYSPATLAFAVTCVVGIIQMGMGIFRLGFALTFLSTPVLSGFTSGAAIRIMLTQIGSFFGMKKSTGGTIIDAIPTIILGFATANWFAFMLGAISFVLVIASRRLSAKRPIFARVPWLLFVMLFMVLIVYITRLDRKGVVVVGEFPSGLPPFEVPKLSSVRHLVYDIFIISAVGFLESIAVAKLYADRFNYPIDVNQELVALGAANLVGSFFSAMPIGGGFARSAVNYNAKARTQISPLISALVVILSLFVLTPLFGFLANAVLAAMIIISVSTLIDFNKPRVLWTVDRFDFMLWLLCFVLTVAISVESGIVVSVIVSLLLIVYRAARPHTAELGRVAGTTTYSSLKRFPSLVREPRVCVFRVESSLYFANTEFLFSRITSLQQLHEASNDPFDVLILDFGGVVKVDSTALTGLEKLNQELQRHGIAVIWADVRLKIRLKMEKMGVLNRGSFVATVNDAIMLARKIVAVEIHPSVAPREPASPVNENPNPFASVSLHGASAVPPTESNSGSASESDSDSSGDLIVSFPDKHDASERGAASSDGLPRSRPGSRGGRLWTVPPTTSRIIAAAKTRLSNVVGRRSVGASPIPPAKSVPVDKGCDKDDSMV